MNTMKILPQTYEYFKIEIQEEFEIPQPDEPHYSIKFIGFPRQVNMTVRHMTLDELKSLHQLLGEVISEEGGES